ncbi:membrane-associated protein, putative [Bodo saltans]|uniref:Membrane-associated protein, putative n=1 Tax=Bodo saltans TaxID=75058 RepID=A0A0S4KM83_BODSA|nr:membrane-associated protein, putative [Bodo saltans]|eukprot:CUI14739.1 membrane-associated protein, putative [Bodo saltans]
MYICRKPSERAIFWLPLARLMLWMLGGLMEYSRGLLLQLLKRKAKRPLLAIVLLPAPVVAPGRQSCATLHIEQKGIFAAALKTGSPVVPAVVLADGSVAYGKVVTPCAESDADKNGVVLIPSPDQVRRLSTAFGEELVQLYKSVANIELRVD